MPGTKPFKTSEQPALKAIPNSSATNTHGQWRRQANGPVHMLSLLSLSARTALLTCQTILQTQKGTLGWQASLSPRTP